MQKLPDSPTGWLDLQARMSRAKTPEEVNEILQEMKQALAAYEAKVSRSRHSPIPCDTPEERKPGDVERL